MRIPKLVAFAAFAALGACGPDQTLVSSAAPISPSAVDPGNAGGNRYAMVMTRNLYLGGAIELFLAPDVTLDQIPALATTVWQEVQATNFPERAKAIADEIQATGPALVGLQEAALWRTQSPGDGNLTPATDVAYDFLEILLDELRSRDLDYSAVVVQENTDIEVYTTLGVDVRLTDRDAILARPGVQVEETSQGTYQAVLELQLGGPEGPIVDIFRGWTGARVSVQGLELAFGNTHLEPFAEPVQELQAQELIATFAGEDRPVIMVGDFNATPGSTSYGYFIAGGYVDAFGALHPGIDGFTCCQADLLDNETSQLYERVDLALLKGALVPLTATVVGASPEDRTASGFWPSDHAGVVSKVRIQDPRFVGLQ